MAIVFNYVVIIQLLMTSTQLRIANDFHAKNNISIYVSMGY